MRFLLKPIFVTLVLSLMLAPITMSASWGPYFFNPMPDSIRLQVIGTIPASQGSRYLESKTAAYIDLFHPPTAEMADQTMKIEIKCGNTTDIDLTHRMHYTNFNSIEDPRGYIYKRYMLSLVTLSPKSDDTPIISATYSMYGIPQIFYNDKILKPEPVDLNGTLIFRWIQ